MSFKVPEQFRLNSHLGDMPGDLFGAFSIPSPYRPFEFRRLLVIASASAPDLGVPWDHVSVHASEPFLVGIMSIESTPIWDEMCHIKDLFWDDEDCVVQYHPPKIDYVNCHKYTLHLWHPTEDRLPMPPKVAI